MATRTFLTPEQLKEASKILRPPLDPPHGQVLLDHSLTTALDFSSWLSLNIENRMREIKGWEDAAPIAIGSWGRGELAPGSDLDVIFCGDPKAVRRVIRTAEERGMKFRSRLPENPDDWSQGVEVLETNALFNAKPFTQEASEKLQIQKDKIEKTGKRFRRKLLSAINQERRLRFKRYDSIANFLEPNLKFGAGGLRDLHQAMMLAYWFPERFTEAEYAFKVLDYYKCLFLMIRHKLHLSNTHDQLTASEQHEMVEWFGFTRHREFMSEVQKGLSRVSFHSNWTIERCQLNNKEFDSCQNLQVDSWQDVQKQLLSDPNLQVQGAIRKRLYETDGFKKEKISKPNKGKILKKLLDIKQTSSVTEAAFRSHVISHLIPAFTKVIGLVQHDQYHRFSVDAHLLQAVLEVKRIQSHPKLLGKLQFYGEKLKITDWNMLRWAALYHDIGKGQPGSHSEVGKRKALRDLRAFGFPKDFVQEVAWLVEHHLILSTAAFRKNPQSPKTWEYLFSKGVKGSRLYRLAIFTVIDIIATNPDAWNTWKENLICEMVDTLRNPSQERHYEFSQKVKRKHPDVPEEFINQLDSELLENISHNVLIKDFGKVLSGKQSGPLIFRDKKGRIWVRFHRLQDEPGLVLEFTRKLTAIGCNIRQAFVYTDKAMGVYDWFCVKTQKTPGVLKKQLAVDLKSESTHETLFSRIELITFDNSEWVFSFRARDKKGLLLSAIQTLHEEDMEIVWAKVHTWGRQIDDVFGLLPKKGVTPQEQLTRLKQLLEKPELEIL